MVRHVPYLGRGINRHHAFWQDRHYRGKLERGFRSHEGLVVPMFEVTHQQLHIALSEPKKPNPDQIRQVLGAMSLWRPTHDKSLGALVMARDEFHNMSLSDNPDLVINAEKIANHLTKQMSYMKELPTRTVMQNISEERER